MHSTVASNLKEAQELNSIAKATRSRTMIGLQGQLTPIILKLKSLTEQDGKIGKVLSSSVQVFGGTRTRNSLPEGLKYFTDREVGGNLVTVGFGHLIGWVGHVLGELSTFNSHLSVQRPRVDIKGSDGENVKTITTDVPDYISLQGTLVASGAPLSVTLRRGPPFKDDPSLTWLIHGEKGEIKVRSAAAGMQASDGERSNAVHNFETDEVEIIQRNQPFSNLPERARNVAAIYEAFAKGDTGRYPNFEHAMLRHAQIEEVFRRFEEGRKGKYL